MQDGRSSVTSARRFWKAYASKHKVAVFQKGHSDPPALHGTIFCSRNTIRFETSTIARTITDTNPGLLGCDRAEHPTAHSSCSANTDNSTHAKYCGYFC